MVLLLEWPGLIELLNLLVTLHLLQCKRGFKSQPKRDNVTEQMKRPNPIPPIWAMVWDS